MSGTRRVPLVRRPAVQITPRAIDLYAAMGKLKCTCPPPSPTRSPCPGCERWADLHDDLHRELGAKPWEWPVVARRSPKRAGSTCMTESIAATMALLDEAVRRRASTASSTASSRPREEEDTNADPVAGEDTLA
jgi:hypothetical protein